MTPFRLRDATDGRVHFSLAKRIAASPRHARYVCEHPSDPTPAMSFGSLVDGILMPVASRPIEVYTGETRRGKAWDAFLAASTPGAIIAKTDEYARAFECADAVRNDPAVRDLDLMSGEQQRVVQWDMFGLPWATGITGVRGGFDLLGADWIADVKTTPVTEPRQWSRHARRMLYPVQLAAYRMAASSIGRHIKNCYIVGVETKAPHCVTVLRVPDEDLDLGLRTLHNWCERIVQCEAADSWPGYVQSAVDLEPGNDWGGLFESEDA